MPNSYRQKPCKGCGNSFQPKSVRHNYCSLTCHPPRKERNFLSKNGDYIRERRLKVKQQLIEAKGGKCSRCGYDKCIGALEFHHTDPNQKEFSLSTRGLFKASAKIMKEVEKCILVCANCHREIHDEEHKAKRANKAL